jgi:hypothetical protein
MCENKLFSKINTTHESWSQMEQLDFKNRMSKISPCAITL